ncbi:MAG: CHAT domain-containing protein [Chloroflexales bacterium]|nr:CHAT domain-containing protein [Chloroflexales bacterium]
MPLTTVELHIRRLPDASLAADATLTSATSAASSQLATGVPVTLDTTALLSLSGDPAAYGREMSQQLFAAPALRDAWLKARAYAAAGSDLQLRLRLDPAADDLHALRWETLRDPESDQPIALHERVRLVRFLNSADLTPVVIPPRPALRALVVVANPRDLGTFSLAEVDVEGEVARARAALGDIPATILGDTAGAAGRATLASITAQLRQAPPIVILVAHGTLRDGQPVLWLEREDGVADPVPGADFIAAVERLAARPLLLVLASCRSAGGGYGDTLSGLGPSLARAGVPAVLGFQGDVAMGTVKALLPALISELRRDGQIDRALAAARAALGEARPWWQAVLWLRVREGWLWEEAPPLDPRLADRERQLHAIVRSHSDLIGVKLARFVGREAELAEIEQRIAELHTIGGYLIIQGRAGQGKSSVLAAFVASTFLAHAQQPVPDAWDSQRIADLERTVGPEQFAHHFIPYEPGRDYQVNLLRDLNARLARRGLSLRPRCEGGCMSSEQQAGAMGVAEAIRRKRAVRAYTSEPVPEDVIMAILNAGRRAQSSKNSQPWTFILVTEREQLARVAGAGNYAAHMPGSAFTVVLVAAPGSDFDLGQAAANMQLAATAAGVGSCVTFLHHQELAHQVLGVPADLSCQWAITFGYPAEAERPLKPGGRRPLEEVVRRERYEGSRSA